MAKRRKRGKAYATSVVAHKRSPSRKTMKKRAAAGQTGAQVKQKHNVKKSSRAQIYWGPAKKINMHNILEVRKKAWFKLTKLANVSVTKMPTKMMEVAQMVKPNDPAGAVAEVIKMSRESRTNVGAALQAGIQNAIRSGALNIVPQRTGALRSSLEHTLTGSYKNLMKQNWPAVVRMGTPGIKYATIVNAFDDRIKLRHKSGYNDYQTYSGKQAHYFVQNSDEMATHEFWPKLVKIIQDFCYDRLVVFYSETYGLTIADAAKLIKLLFNVKIGSAKP